MFEKFRYKKFLILSLIAFIITGVVITLATLNHLKTDKIQSAKDLTLLTLNSILKPQLRSEDFQMPLPDNRVNVLNNALTEIMTDTGIMGIRIWNQKNEVIFSSNISATIDTEDINNFANLQEIEARVIKLDQSNNNIKLPNPKTLQIFTPISIDNTRIGTYEVLIPYSIVEQHLKDVALVISAFMGIGLCILYIVWLRLAFNVSRDLISHNTILTAQRNQLQNYSDMLNTTYKNTVKTLTYAIDAKDTYTAGHSQRVATISNIISVSLGLAEAEQKVIELAALFHDIGKLGIPDEILNKPGKLSELEIKKIKQHPVTGVNILKNIEFLVPTLPIILHHHERYSGGGYPDSLLGNSIPLGARILAVADTYDAITSDRSYRKGLTHEEAVKEILRNAGTQFDNEIVQEFIKVHNKIKHVVLQQKPA